MRLKISIITSAFRSDQYIEHFLEDITSQTAFSYSELILINPKPTSTEKSVISRFCAEFPNIVWKQLSEDKGLYWCWNIGVREAKGDYLTNANVDDRQSLWSLETMAKALDSDESLDLVYGSVLVTNQKNVRFGEAHTTGIYPCLEHSFENLLSNNSPHCQPMWRKSLHDRFGFFDEKLRVAADTDMWLRAAQGGAKMRKIPEILGLYYENPDGLSTNSEKLAESVREVNMVRDRYRKDVVSFSLWGSAPKYCVGAIQNLELSKKIYPDREVHFFISSDSDKDTIDLLKNNGAKVHILENQGWKNLFWRFTIIDSPLVKSMICRDTDSRIGAREKAAVDEWMQSDKLAHAMFDHPHHAGYQGRTVLGGMFGLKRGMFNSLSVEINSRAYPNEYGADYNFFSQLYPYLSQSIMIHSSCGAGRPFPTDDRTDTNFVGAIFDENNNFLLSNH